MVNFLLHHHLASRDLGRPEAGVGAMLPDVWRMADRRARVRGKAGAPVADTETGADEGSPARAMVEGVAHHLATDAWFHRSPEFTRGESAVREVLRRAKDSPKLGLFAHVTWELCLDGALLRRQGTASVLGEVRRSIERVRPELHHRLAATLVPVPVAERQVFEARVDRILDALVEGPWIAGYATDGGILERLEGVRRRLGFGAMPASDHEQVAEGLQTLASGADASLDGLLAGPRPPRDEVGFAS